MYNNYAIFTEEHKIVILGFSANPQRPSTYEARIRLMELSRQAGYICHRFEELPQDGAGIDLLVVVGGDGALIRRAKEASIWNVPLMGVNLGRIGFLSEVCEADFPEALRRYSIGEYYLDERAMLDCSLNGEYMYSCLNDVLVFKHSFSGVTQMELFVNGESVGTLFGDGVVAASPTGATGYSLSAGGPIVAGELRAMLVTPICPHTLHMRPIATSIDSSVVVKVVDKAVLAGDGVRLAELNSGDSVAVTGSKRSVKLVRFERNSLFRRIRERLT